MSGYLIFDGQTVRPANDDETANIDTIHAEADAALAEQAARDEARQSAMAKLSALGLTDAEIAALLGA